jgi:alpha-galactosidase
MTNGVRISIIGAGSGEFSLGIVRDLCLTPGLWGSTVSFMDINRERLDAVHNVATRYTAELGADLAFEKTLDRGESLRGADFVINTAMVGGWDRYRAGWDLSLRHGYAQPVLVDSYYQYRLFLDVIRDMEALCPNAWYIQSANPVFEGCTLVTRNSTIKAVGLCHGFYGYRHIARVLGLDPDKVQAQAYGINHFIWLTKFRYEGKDAYPILDEWIETRARDYWASPECGISDEMGPKAVDVYRRLGLFPVGDTVTPGGESYFRWYHVDKQTELRWQEDPVAWYDHHVRHVNERVSAFMGLAQDPSAKATQVFPAVKTMETNVSIIDAIVNDRPAIFQVNIPNRGCIRGVADDVVVEVPALVSGAGIQGLRMGDLPRRIMCHLIEKVVMMERDLEAFQARDRRMLLELILTNPQTRSIEQAQALLDEVLSLPMNQEMAAYYS